MLPLDLLEDLGAFKADPAERRPVSNSLLSDPLVAFVPWDAEVSRLLAAGEPPFVFSGEGGPLLADPQTAIFSPFAWPRFLFGLEGWALSAVLVCGGSAAPARWRLLLSAACKSWDGSPGGDDPPRPVRRNHPVQFAQEA